MNYLFTAFAGIIFTVSITFAHHVKAEGFSVDTSKLPSVVASDAAYSFPMSFTVPEDLETVDILLSLKSPSQNYTLYASRRETVTNPSLGFQFYHAFLLDTPAPVGGDYIWEVKFLPTGQTGEENPIFYHTQPVSIKETGFKIGELEIPSELEPYDTYNITINYLFDEGAKASLKLINDETGEVVIAFDKVGLYAMNRWASETLSTTVVNDPEPGSYSWNLEVYPSRANSSLVYSKSVAAEIVLEDEIKDVSMDSIAITPGMMRDIEVAYTATEDRELMFEFWSSNTQDYRVVYESVSRGSGKLTVPVEVPYGISKQHDYYWWVKIIPVDGQWWEHFSEMGRDAIVAANPTQDTFFDYPIYYFPGEVFTSTHYGSTYTLQIGSNIIGSDSGIFLRHVTSGGKVDYLFNLRTGDITTKRDYSWADYSEMFTINPYYDARKLEDYRREVSAFESHLRSALGGNPELNDMQHYISSVIDELSGKRPEFEKFRKLHYGTLFRVYDFDFTWNSDNSSLDTIIATTNGVDVDGESHLGFSLLETSFDGLLKDNIALDLETGFIVRSVDDDVSYNDTVQTVAPPYIENASNEQAYIALLVEIKQRLDKLASGTQIDGIFISKPYPQMREYSAKVEELIQQLTPIHLYSEELYFGGEVDVFDYEFISRGAGNHPTIWKVVFSQAEDGTWQVEASKSPGFPTGRVIAKMNLSSGELNLLDETYGNYDEELNFSAVPPSQGGDTEQYEKALSRLIENISVVETQRIDYISTRPFHQLKQFRLYLEGTKKDLK